MPTSIQDEATLLHGIKFKVVDANQNSQVCKLLCAEERVDLLCRRSITRLIPANFHSVSGGVTHLLIS